MTRGLREGVRPAAVAVRKLLWLVIQIIGLLQRLSPFRAPPTIGSVGLLRGFGCEHGVV